MIWLGFAILVLMTIGFFMLRTGKSEAAADPIALYKKQLADIHVDEANGVLEKDAAAAARLEIERRILRVKTPGEAQQDVENSAAPMILCALAVTAAALIYYFVGMPHLPAAPGRMITVQDAPVEEGGPSFREAIERVEGHLANNPQDHKGWEVLAKSARAVGDFSRAATAFGKLAELEPNNVSWRAQELEAYIAMGAGQVTPAAKIVLQQLLQDEPEHPAGHYYLGLARRQVGDENGARAIWLALADRSDANAPWMPVLNERLTELGVRPPRLSNEQISAVAEMTTEERDLFVKSMIDRLKERLESEPNDPEGWLMLARSQLAIEGKEAAIASLKAGIEHVGAEKALEMKAFLDNLLSNTDP